MAVSSSSSSSSEKGLNPYAPEFIKSDERQRLLINPNPYASSFYYCFFSSSSSTCFLSSVSLFPNEFIYPPPHFEGHHALPVVVPPHHYHQPEVDEVQQQQTHGTGYGDDVLEEATQIKPPRRVFRGSKRGGYKGYGRFFDRKVVGTTSSQKMEWKPAAALKSTSTTEKKVVHNKRSFVVDYSWDVPRRMMKKFSDVRPVKKDGDGTTVMIRNIPNRYSRDLLMTFLDKHCAKENGKKSESESESAFDFLYLPIDFWTGMNKGYAFANFTNPEAVWRFFMATNGHNWDLFDSNKIREIAYARIQGKEELVEHFQTMGFPCQSEEVLPVIFSPARDGSSSAAVEMTCIGKLEGWNVIDKWQESQGSRKKQQPTSSAPRFDLND